MYSPQPPIDEVDSKATLADVIAALNTVIRRLNEMWYPEDGSNDA